MSQYLDSNRIFRYVILLVPPLALIGLHLEHLNLPHFWDEAWVYAPALKKMSTIVPSIFPDSIPVDLSRGHPLLFQFIGGWWNKLFGMSNASNHLYALFLSSITLILFQKVIGFISNYFIAFCVSLLVVFPSLFFNQSFMIYPEVLLSLSLWLALLGYFKEKIGVFLLGAFVMAFSKESSIVFLLSIFIWDLYRCLFFSGSFKSVLISFLGLSFFSLPFVLNRIYLGWYFYPEHTSLVELNFWRSKYLLKEIYFFMFEQHGRYWIMYGTLFLTFVAVVQSRYWKMLVLVPFVLAAHIVFWEYKVLSMTLYVLVLAAIILIPLVVLAFSKYKSKLSKRIDFIGIAYVSILGFFLFSSINFFTWRYLTPLVLILFGGVAVILEYVFKNRKLLITVVLFVLSIPVLSHFRNDTLVREVNMGLYTDLEVQQKLINWLDENIKGEGMCTNFVTNNYMFNPYAGYIDHEVDYIEHANSCQDCDQPYLVLTTTSDCKENERKILYAHPNAELVYSDSMGQSFAKVYLLKE